MRTTGRLLVLALAALLCSAPVRAPDAAPPPELGPLEGKVIWVDFWASWCVPCRRSFPWLNSMQRKYGEQGLQIVGVNVDAERGAANEFLETTPAEFALRFDPEGRLASAFDVQAMPSSYLLDAEGNVIARHFGFRLADTEEYERTISKALAAR